MSVHLSGHPFIFSFLDDNLSKYQWVFTKLCMCIDMESGLGLLMGKFHEVLTEFSACRTIHVVLSFHFFIPHHTIVAGYYGFMMVIHVSVCLFIHLSHVHLYFRFRLIT